jgi:hypothetical protein
MLYKRLKIKIQMWYFYIVIIKKALKKQSKIDGVVRGYTVVDSQAGAFRQFTMGRIG